MLSLSLKLLIILASGIIQAESISPRASKYPHLDSLVPFVTASIQEDAVRALLLRSLPASTANQFDIHVKPIGTLDNDVVELSWSNGKVVVNGSSGVSVAWGINRYLRSCCNVHFSWDGNQTQAIPATLPEINVTTCYASAGRFRYFGNICTNSYAMIYWNWTQWERHIDWMALNGINLPFAPTGQEYIWMRVYAKFGLSRKEIISFFTGAPFFAWNRMGNLKRWGGPLSDEWMAKQVSLQKRILERQTSLGMIPVLPGFAGHVPDAMERHFPSVNFTHLQWLGFNSSYSQTRFMDPQSSLFVNVSKEFITQMNETLGAVYHAYSADPFNEMASPSYEPKYIQSMVKNIYAGLQAADPAAVWVMQGWFLVGDHRWYAKGGLEALFQTLEPGNMLMLDLYSEQIPIYKNTKSYEGQPFVWNMLHNFGGNLGLYGSVEYVNQGVTEAQHFPNSSFVGTGITMEGMFQNYAMYQLALDMGWSQGPFDLQNWIRQYSTERYGSQNNLTTTAWIALWTDVYNYTGPKGPNFDAYIITRRPGFNYKQMSWYKMTSLCTAVSNLYNAAQLTDGSLNAFLLHHDLVDVSREFLQQIFVQMYDQLMADWSSKNLGQFTSVAGTMSTLLDEMEPLLNSHKNFQLEPWLERGRYDATNATGEVDQFLFDFKNQITTWGPHGEILDYARKQWSGLFEAYYAARWKYFFKVLEEDLKTGTPFDSPKFYNYVLNNIEIPFASKPIQVKPSGNPVQLAGQIFTKYSKQYCTPHKQAVSGPTRFVINIQTHRKLKMLWKVFHNQN